MPYSEAQVRSTKENEVHRSARVTNAVTTAYVYSGRVNLLGGVVRVSKVTAGCASLTRSEHEN